MHDSPSLANANSKVRGISDGTRTAHVLLKTGKKRAIMKVAHTAAIWLFKVREKRTKRTCSGVFLPTDTGAYRSGYRGRKRHSRSARSEQAIDPHFRSMAKRGSLANALAQRAA